jgi:hypothetical protein
MKTVWTKGLEPDAAQEMKLHYNGGAQLRKRLSVIIEEKVISRDKSAMSDDGYTDAGWAYRQADTQGYKRALTEILALL